MKQFLCVAAVLACASSPSLAMTDTECAAEFKAADRNNDMMLSEAEGARYFASMRVASKTVNAPMSQADFMTQCKADMFKAAVVDAGAPLKGANSFTESQAKDRVTAAGYSSVSDLKKDDQGIWRGTAAKDAKTLQIAVDYKGNVVAR